MAMGFHRIPFWPEQAMRQLTECLIYILILVPEDHDILAGLLARFSTLPLWNVCPI